jgi:hypothetical protein
MKPIRSSNNSTLYWPARWSILTMAYAMIIFEVHLCTLTFDKIGMNLHSAAVTARLPTFLPRRLEQSPLPYRSINAWSTLASQPRFFSCRLSVAWVCCPSGGTGLCTGRGHQVNQDSQASTDGATGASLCCARACGSKELFFDKPYGTTPQPSIPLRHARSSWAERTSHPNSQNRACWGSRSSRALTLACTPRV